MRTCLRHVLAALMLALASLAVAPAVSAQDESTSAPSASLTDSNSIGAMVTRLYYAFFDRAPDTSGYAFWTNEVTNGRPIADAAEEFAVSNEFVTTYGPLTNAEFIDQIYENVLGRDGDAGGVTFWLGELDNGNRTRGEVVLGMSDSSEFRDRIEAIFPDAPVMRLYCAYYLRMPDDGGRAFWRQQYSWGLPISEISDEFAAAQEFTDRYGSVTNRDFVTDIYVNVLNRAPETGGLSFWTTALDNGAFTRGQVMVEFSESNEYKNRFPMSGTECPEQTYELPDGSPVANDDAASAEVNETIIIDWDANDTLIDSATLESIDDSSTDGTVVDNGNGSFTYTAPATDGTDTFTYTVCDDDSTPTCDTATVTVIVNPVGDGTDPDAVDDAAMTTTATAVVIDWDDNDSLVDGATLDSFDAASTNGGTVVDNGDGTFTYTSAAEFVGTDTFTYTVCDDDPVCDIATITVSVSSPGAGSMACTLYFDPPKFRGEVGSETFDETFIFYPEYDNCYDEYVAYAEGQGTVVIEFSGTTIGGMSVAPAVNDPIGLLHEVEVDNTDHLPAGYTSNIVVESTVVYYLEVDNGGPVPDRTPLVTMHHVANYRISDGSGDVPDQQWIGINGVEDITYHVDPTA